MPCIGQQRVMTEGGHLPSAPAHIRHLTGTAVRACAHTTCKHGPQVSERRKDAGEGLSRSLPRERRWGTFILCIRLAVGCVSHHLAPCVKLDETVKICVKGTRGVERSPCCLGEGYPPHRTAAGGGPRLAHSSPPQTRGGVCSAGHAPGPVDPLVRLTSCCPGGRSASDLLLSVLASLRPWADCALSVEGALAKALRNHPSHLRATA